MSAHTPDAPGADHAPGAADAAAHVAGELAHTGLGHRLAVAVGRAYLTVLPAAQRLALLAHDYQEDVLDTAEDFSRITYARNTDTSTAAHDPIAQHLGVPATFAAAVLSRLAGYVAGRLAGQKASAHAEGPDPAGVVLDLLSAFHAAAGVPDEPLPALADVAAALARRRAARGA